MTFRTSVITLSAAVSVQFQKPSRSRWDFIQIKADEAVRSALGLSGELASSRGALETG